MIDELNRIISNRYEGYSYSIRVEGYDFKLEGISLSEEEYNEIKTEWLQNIPLAILRIQRNQLLAQSDWMAVADRTMTQAQIDYRQALRDLPATADPQLDENGNLTNVTWPTYE